MPTPAINYDNSKRWYISVRPRDALAVVVIGALLNGFFGALFTHLFEHGWDWRPTAHASPTDAK